MNSNTVEIKAKTEAPTEMVKVTGICAKTGDRISEDMHISGKKRVESKNRYLPWSIRIFTMSEFFANGTVTIKVGKEEQ
jgi:hypothetical protein